MQSSLMTIRIANDLRLKLKQQALDENKRMWEIVNEALIKYLNK